MEVRYFKDMYEIMHESVMLPNEYVDDDDMLLQDYENDKDIRHVCRTDVGGWGRGRPIKTRNIRLSDLVPRHLHQASDIVRRRLCKPYWRQAS